MSQLSVTASPVQSPALVETGRIHVVCDGQPVLGGVFRLARASTLDKSQIKTRLRRSHDSAVGWTSTSSPRDPKLRENISFLSLSTAANDDRSQRVANTYRLYTEAHNILTTKSSDIFYTRVVPLPRHREVASVYLHPAIRYGQRRTDARNVSGVVATTSASSAGRARRRNRRLGSADANALLESNQYRLSQTGKSNLLHRANKRDSNADHKNVQQSQRNESESAAMDVSVITLNGTKKLSSSHSLAFVTVREKRAIGISDRRVDTLRVVLINRPRLYELF